MKFDLDPGIKVTRNVAQYHLHHVTYFTTKFKVATSNGLGGDTFTRNMTHGWTNLQDGRSEVSYGVNLVKLTPQARFNPITPYCTKPNLTLTSLNTAVQIVNLIIQIANLKMYRGHVRTDDGMTLARN